MATVLKECRLPYDLLSDHVLASCTFTYSEGNTPTFTTPLIGGIETAIGSGIYLENQLSASKIYPLATSATTTQQTDIVNDMYDTIHRVLVESGFNVVTGIRTTDQEYRYLDITPRSNNGVDIPKYCLFIPTSPLAPIIPNLISYYDGDAATTTSNQFATFITDGITPDATFWGLTGNPFNNTGLDSTLIIHADGITGYFWFAILTDNLCYKFYGATLSHRVEQDMSTPEQGCARYGISQLLGYFSVPYGITYITMDNAPYPNPPENGLAAPMFSLLTKFNSLAGAAGLSPLLQSNVILTLTNQYWEGGSQTYPVYIFGKVEGVKHIYSATPINSLSTFYADGDKYVILKDDFTSSMFDVTAYGMYAFRVCGTTVALEDFA